jgi:hypothetical protein
MFFWGTISYVDERENTGAATHQYSKGSKDYLEDFDAHWLSFHENYQVVSVNDDTPVALDKTTAIPG